MDNSILRHTAWVIWLGIILVLSLLPGDQLPNIKLDWISIDTLAHVIMYLVLSILFLIGFVKNVNKKKKRLNLSDLKVYLVLLLIGVGIGIAIELAQGNLIYRRYFDYKDIVANSFGTILGTFLYGWIGRKLI